MLRVSLNLESCLLNTWWPLQFIIIFYSEWQRYSDISTLFRVATLSVHAPISDQSIWFFFSFFHCYTPNMTVLTMTDRRHFLFVTWPAWGMDKQGSKEDVLCCQSQPLRHSTWCTGVPCRISQLIKKKN